MESVTKRIDGEVFEKLVLNGALNLKANLKTVNDLNVFPIPDGDTGDNMFMTINGGLGDMKAVRENSVCKKAKALANGMLLNARGNSGVILSQLFAGIAGSFEGQDVVCVKAFAEALKAGVKQAYSAVVRPVEGTILTVAREAADYAYTHGNDDTTLDDFMNDYLFEMQKSLEHTPDLLAVLKEAGVVDSGGAGLLYIAEGMKKALDGKTVADTELAIADGSSAELDFSAFTQDSVMEFGYCTEFLLQLQTCKVDVEAFGVETIVEYLESIGGDSIVAFKTGTIIKVHVHTLTPSKALEYCQQFGEFLKVKIENMTLQHNEISEDSPIKMPKKKREHRKYALVTVATGKGLMDTFTEFGADIVIDGGQGKNPSIERFIEAFDEADADYIFVLPNNGNIIMAAKQAAQMYERSDIRVIETKNFGQAYSLLSMLDYGCDDPDGIEAEMKENMSGVVTGMVTRSIRSVTVDGVDITEGSYIGFTDKVMQYSAPTRLETIEGLADELEAGEKSFFIAVYGMGMKADEKSALAEMVAAKYPNLEFYEIEGGQDVYDCILILE